ncbi:CKLF-like MARVEL transmembrane domain-containing protein 6 [Centropristis striata]|uniref:CKLF-like MARVEL transmembrane domain-containing protein 6 n=1 Tax=Centropristis striata TaxID=184440 RepID=UPI0027E07AF4|nr:CKLF-like MARVEL transmembrane domain-containing protein 6 [Centropristis striata]
MGEVYASTTAPNPKASWFIVPSENLDKVRFGLKVIQVLLSLVAFVLEEMVSSCSSCSSLYFFEFVSCTAFLFTLLLLILLSTSLNGRVGITCWTKLDFVYSCSIALLFLIASIVFASDNSNTTLERSAVAFGFLATVIFFLDAGWHVKTLGSPFAPGGTPQTSNGGPVAVESQPETEKLAGATSE